MAGSLNAVRIAPTDEAIRRRAANIGGLFRQPHGERPVQKPRLIRVKRIPGGGVGWGFPSWHNALGSEHAHSTQEPAFGFNGCAMARTPFFGVEPQLWMNLQSQYDLEVAERSVGATVDADIAPLRDAA